MIVSDPMFTWPEMWRGVVERGFTHFKDTAYQFFLPREGFTHILHEDGLGADICVASWRPEALLEEINKRAFRAFTFEKPQVDTYGFYWTRFRAM
jgi:hypothetical protein